MVPGSPRLRVPNVCVPGRLPCPASSGEGRVPTCMADGRGWKEARRGAGRGQMQTLEAAPPRPAPGLRAAIRERLREDQELPSPASARGLGPLAEEATGPGDRDPQVGGSGRSGSGTDLLLQRDAPAFGFTVDSPVRHTWRCPMEAAAKGHSLGGARKRVLTPPQTGRPATGHPVLRIGAWTPSLHLPRRHVCGYRHVPQRRPLVRVPWATQRRPYEDRVWHVLHAWDHQGPRVHGVLRAARRMDGGGRHAAEEPRSLSLWGRR